MTNPTPHGQVPEALRLAHIFDNPLPPEWPDMVAARAVLAKWGTQPQAGAVPQGWKAVPVNPTPEMWKAAKTVPDPNPPYPPHYGLVWDAMLVASPTPPAEQQAQPDECFPGEPKVAVPQGLISAACFAIRKKRDGGKVLEQLRRYSVGDRSQPLAPQQAAPKAAPGVGNSGFDHKTAADLLNNKTVSDEAVRKFVATSRWAHDERAALSATLLAMHGVLTSREAEIALLKKALLEAEAAPKAVPWEQNESAYQRGYMDGMAKGRRDVDAAPQQEAQEPVATLHCNDAGYVWARATEVGKRMRFEQPLNLYTAPQPAPAPLSESIDQVERALAIIGVVGAIDGHDVVRRESVLEIARRAALAAQGGSK